ncbi:branched-chain amino acid ABC transporter permease [Roseomonas sp. NAR14]|uniref:Branched-chain amino acid ABC transporter permease n=1 Tax=Roseomonas acroporae TaxID=2937791 RepID=A0A9X2BUI6_9PROT|nr:branched-chain amino acid ABC transporter permease [Roseomonas acroporae]
MTQERAIDPVYAAQLTLNGLLLGLLYALIVSGLALLFGVLGIINFAHGEFLMAGAYLMAFALPVLGLAYLPSLLLAMLGVALLGCLAHALFLRRLREDEFERSILMTTGLSILLLNAVQYALTATPLLVDTQFGFDGIDLGGINITWTRIAAAAAAILALLLLWLCLTRTQLGRAMRAIAQNREAAMMVGIRPEAVARNAVILATALCGLAGAALAPIQLVQPSMGQFLIFKAFALVIIGGLGSIPGAAIAAVLLGLLESWIGGFFDAVWQEVVVFVAMMLVLLLRPDGLFGAPRMRAG